MIYRSYELEYDMAGRGCLSRIRGDRQVDPSDSIPEGPTYTTIMELGPQDQNRDGFFGA